MDKEHRKSNQKPKNNHNSVYMRYELKLTVFFFVLLELMTESVNHTECGHNCNPSELTGPVVITKPPYNNITLHLPINKDTTGHEPEEEASQGTAIMFTGVTYSCRLRFYKASNETNFSGGFDDGVFDSNKR